MNTFKMQPRNRFFQVNRHLVEHEINSGVTVTFMSEVDLSSIRALRERAGTDRPSYTAWVAKAVAIALQEYPYANRRVCKRPFRGTRVQQFHGSDVAIAVEREIPDAQSVAFVDVMRDTQQQSLKHITQWLRELSQADVDTNVQWRDFSRLVKGLPSWLASLLISLPTKSPKAWCRYRGGAALISSPAKYGVDSVVATWPWPLGISFGLVKDRAVVVNGQVEVRPTFMLVLNFDRRIMAGAPAAKFFKRLVNLLEQPEALMCEDTVGAESQRNVNSTDAHETSKNAPGHPLQSPAIA